MEAGERPRRGAPARGDVSARERILATAGELFYREDIRAYRYRTSKSRRSANSDFSSPDWNISRTISAPPTNSPLM
jgi:hypothetical protein